jgi:hypothetical protein
MAHRTVITLTVTALLAILAAGCGSASTSTSSSTAHATVASAPVTAAATPAAPAVPPGFSRYQAKGFSFLAPSGFKAAPDGGLGGLPAGASAVMLTPGGRRVENTSTQIIVATNPRLRTNVNLDQVALSLETADASNRSAKNVHTAVGTMTVAGAEQVRTVTESYVGPNGPHDRTLFHRTWLMVMPKPGLLMDLVVVNEPQRGGRLNPATVLDTFRLGG